MTESTIDFQEFMKQREKASSAFVNGDFNPLAQISTQTSPATIFGLKGDCVQGADKVNETNAKGSKLFQASTHNAFQVMHMASDENLAYWVGIQRSIVQMHGQEQAVPMDLRVTEIFRREGGLWKLMHRHADRLASGAEA